MWGVPKNHRHREIAIPAGLRDDLNQHILDHVPTDPDALVFTSPMGQPLRSTNFHKTIWKPSLAAAELDPRLRIHDLRHTCEALMIAAGAHPEAIKRHLGHSSITVTMDRYRHLFPSEADAIADRLDTVITAARADYPRTPEELSVPRGEIQTHGNRL